MDTWCDAGAERNIKAALLRERSGKRRRRRSFWAENVSPAKAESIIHQSHGTILTSGLGGRRGSPGKGLFARRTVFERPGEIRTARRRTRETERNGETREERLRADTIPEEPGSISEAVTSAERASFPGNRKLRRAGGKCRQATHCVVLHSFHSSLEIRPFYLLGYDPGEEIGVETFPRIAQCRFNSRDSSEGIWRKQAWNNLLPRNDYIYIIIRQK